MSFTPEEITEILQIYFDNFVNQTYTGMRYVPIFGRRGEASIDWDNSEPYEPLTIVIYNNESYTSRQFVPAGAAITDTDYWAKTGAYNAQIIALQDALPIAQFDSENTVKDYIDELGSFLPASDFDNDNTVKAYIDGFADLLPSSAFDSVNTVRGALNGRVRAFETVADMAAATDLAEDMICHTNGFHTSGDGGAAFYEIKASGTANAMDIIACQDSLLAHLVITEPFVTPEQFGAYGDGTHDDVTYLQAATDKLFPIKLASKTYVVKDSQLAIKSDFIGNNTKIIMPSGDASEHRIEYRNVSNIKTANIEFDTSGSQKGIGVFYSSFLTFDNCHFNAGTFAESADIWVIRTLDLYTDWHDIKITNCKFTEYAQNAEGGFWIRNFSGTNGASYNCTVENCIFEHCTIDECVAIWGTHGVYNVSILNSHFIVKLSSPIMIQTSGVNTTIANCTFDIEQGFTTNRNPNNLSSLKTDTQLFTSSYYADHNIKTLVENCTINYTPDNDTPYKNLRLHDATSTTNPPITFDTCAINYGMRIIKCIINNCSIDNVSLINDSEIRDSNIKYQSLSSGQMSQGKVKYFNSTFDLKSNALFFVQDLGAGAVWIINCILNNAAQRIYFSNNGNEVRIIGNTVYNTSYDLCYIGSADGALICTDNVLYSSSSGIASKNGSNYKIENNLKIAPTP